MDIKCETEIKDESLERVEDNEGADEEISELLQDGNCDSVIDIKSEIEIKEESLDIRMVDSKDDEVLKFMPEINEVQNLIFEEEKSGIIEGKWSSGSDPRELGRENKGTKKHDWKEFSYSDCDFTFESGEEMISHLESLSKGKVKCRCRSDCNCESKSKNELLNIRHKGKNILKRESLKCSECDYECKQKAYLKSHLLRHQNIKLFRCLECDYESNHKGELKIHVLNHQNIKLFRCCECRYDCTRKDVLKRHMLTHQNIKLFKCFECSYECNEKRSIKIHMLNHQNIRLFRCSECRYECNLKVVLKRHMLTHQIIRMEFGLDKCATLTLKKGRPVLKGNIVVEELVIKELEQGNTYKYLGMEESEKIEHKLIKDRISKEYIRRTKKILKTQLNTKNKITAIRTLAVPVLTYGFGIIDWYQYELNRMDTSTRKMLHAHKVISKNQCSGRIYAPRTEGGLYVPMIDKIYKTEIVGINEYMKRSRNMFLWWVKNHEEQKAPSTSITKKARDYLQDHGMLEEEIQEENHAPEHIKRIKVEYRKNRDLESISNWEEHAYAKFYREDVLKQVFIDKKRTLEVINNGWLRTDEERIIRGAQDQAIRTNWFKRNIEGDNVSDRCRICAEKAETINHILAGCETLLHRGTYTDRHNSICRLIRYEICKRYEVNVRTEKYWQHEPSPIEENNRVLLLYDHPVPTDLHIQNCRPDIILKDKLERKCYIIEVGVPNDGNVAIYEREKILKYQRLRNEIKRMWGEVEEVEVIPVVIGALGAIKKRVW